MSRAASFIAYSAAFAIVYILLWLDVIPVPFLDASVKDQLVPVVSDAFLVVATQSS